MDTRPLSSDINNPRLREDDLLPLVLLHQVRRDQAIGLPGPGRKTLSLDAYRCQQQAQAVDRLARIAFLRGVVDACQAEIARLVDGAGTPDQRREALPHTERLVKLAERATGQLEALNA